MSVKVGVRVRPFNAREVELNCKLCVEMVGNTTRLLDLEDSKRNRDFAFDYSFWSHDEFTTTPSGYFEPDSKKYSDQKAVFEAVGIEILDNAWKGYHCCLFAYGQTGSGKSYSMVGYGANKGIVPISCEEIFTRIHNNEEKNKEYEVDISMLEIYNERVQDLLIPINKRPKEGLKIREHKTLGVYVEGLSKHLVQDYPSIEQKMEEGSRNRSVAATEMNASSSRAHTIISIEFRQREMINDKKVEKLSVIYLVDLAGSEKVGKTGATGDRLKEAAGINKSLSVLGLVISTLADKAMGKGKNIIVPYRDSCLTRILQNALGGNSKTLMICAISPATDNYEETLSTLRYADQAKKIQNKAVINESETDKMIRELTEENEKLKKFMEMFSKMGININDEASLSKFDEKTMAQLTEARSEMNFNNQMMNSYSMSKEEKIKHEEEERAANQPYTRVDISKPHLSNLNEDPFLSRKICYSIDKGQIRIGRKNAQPKNDIEIMGHSVLPLLATINFLEEENKYVIVPKSDPNAEGATSDNFVYLNGQLLSEETQLLNMDRLKFGVNSIFLVIIPDGEERPREDTAEIDWEYAQQELYLLKEKQELAAREKENKLKEEEEARLREKEQELAEIKRRQKESEEEMKQMMEKIENEKAELEARRIEEERKHTEQLKALQLEKEIENEKKRIKDEENQRKNKVKEKYYFENKLMKTLPKVIELNLIAKEFKRNISMAVKMMLFNQDSETQAEKMNIKVQVDNRELGYRYLWDLNKFSNRYYIIKDMIEKYYETGVIPEVSQNEDPFWDPPEPLLIGKSFLTPKGMVHILDNPADLAIIGENHLCGQLKVDLIPTDERGQRNLSEQVDEEEDCEPEDLIGKPFYFNVVIKSAKIPDNYQNIFVEYSLRLNGSQLTDFKTNMVMEQTKTPVFNYKQTHSYANITDEILNYLQTTNLVFRIFGNELIKGEKKDKSKAVCPDQEKAKMADEEKRNQPQQPVQGSQLKTTTTNGKTTVTTAEPKPPAQPITKAPVQPTQKATPTPTATAAPADKSGKKEEPKKDDKKKKTGKEKDDCTVF